MRVTCVSSKTELLFRNDSKYGPITCALMFHHVERGLYPRKSRAQHINMHRMCGLGFKGSLIANFERVGSYYVAPGEYRCHPHFEIRKNGCVHLVFLHSYAMTFKTCNVIHVLTNVKTFVTWQLRHNANLSQCVQWSRRFVDD